MTTTIPRRLDSLTPLQHAVALAFLAERSAERHHLVVYLSGAHAYGFPSPDSDLDLKCVHVAPTSDLVGLHRRIGAGDRLVTIDGVELDYGSNELADVLRGVLGGNGNYLERILGDLVLDADDALLVALRPLVRAALSRRFVRHYNGFATSQRRAADQKPTAKKVLYVLRTARTGYHLLRTGELITDLNRLAALYGPDVRALIDRKQSGEQAPLADDELAGWQAVLDRVMSELSAAVADSPLPPDPPPAAAADLDTWLRDVRRARW